MIQSKILGDLSQWKPNDWGVRRTPRCVPKANANDEMAWGRLWSNWGLTLSTCKLKKYGSFPLHDPFMYKFMVGVLQYVTLTHPDIISFNINKAYQYMVSPLNSHWLTVKCILHYLSGTIDHGFIISQASPSWKLSLHAYKDFDWVSDPDDSRSIYGSCIYLGLNLVSRCSKKQYLVSSSSTEDE